MRFRAFVRFVLPASATVAVALGSVVPASAGAGDVDPGFGEGGAVTTAFPGSASGTGVVVQQDGKIVVAGTTDSHDIALARYNPNGSIDESFGSGGQVVVAVPGGADPSDAALGAGGRIVVAATGLNPRAFVVARFDPSGAPDKTFGNSGIVTTHVGKNDTAGGMGVRSDGKIVVVGGSEIGGSPDFVVIRYLSSGSLDAGFGSQGVASDFFGSSKDTAGDFDFQPDGKIVLAGTSDGAFALARCKLDGDLDPTFGSGGLVTTPFSQGNAAVTSVDASGQKIVVGGEVHSGTAGKDFQEHFALARYTPDGSLDRAFGPDGKVVSSFTSEAPAGGAEVAVQNNFRVVVIGTVWTTGGSAVAVARYDPNGRPDQSFGNDGSHILKTPGPGISAVDVGIQADGKILTAGGYRPGNEPSQFLLMRFLGAREQPDAMIAPAPGKPFKGGNIYNGRGLRETLATTAPIGGAHTFVIRIQNDGSNRDTFVVDSTRNVHGFSLTFRSGGVNVTARMLAGTYRIEDLRPGRSVSITAKVTVWGSQAPGKAHLWRVSAVAPSNLTTADAVRFKVAARRRA